MTQETFRAGVHYGDLKGTIAADHHQNEPLERFFENQKLIQPGEYLIGYQVDLAASDLGKMLTVRALLTGHVGYANVKEAIESGNPLKVRKVSAQMPTEQFFSYFKQMELCISRTGMLTGREIDF
ncbi:MAG: hypothetical protein WBF95_08865 [Comamonas thiooxydans]